MIQEGDSITHTAVDVAGDRLPVGIQLIARPFEEATILRAAYAYEQATQHRRPPPTAPKLAGEPH